MRKFVIKHRQKRKYTKKAEEISSYSFSKTITGMLPLLVMVVAFMTTFVISVPFRTAFSHLEFHITVQMPQFSLENPLEFFQTLLLDMTQVSGVVWTVILTVGAFIREMSSINIHSFFIFTINSLVAAGNILGFIGQGLISIFSFLEKIILTTAAIIASIFTATFALITHTLIIGEQAVIALVNSLGAFSIAIASVMWNGISSAVVLLYHFFISASIALFLFILMIIETLWLWFTFIINSLITAFIHAITAIVHVIEIPFKILYAFWLQIKPYTDILNRHIAMTGADLNNGFASWSKVGTLLSSSK